jgi:hypothetical protein
MIKVIGLFKKRKGMTDAEFRDYYENHHVRVFDELMKNPGMERYIRRYLTPVADPTTGEVRSAGFDVIMELWISDPELFQSQFQSAQDSEFRRLVAEDEARLFDRSEMYTYVVEDFESDLAALREAGS